MAKGIVKSTPAITQPGSIAVTDAGTNVHNVTDGAQLEFDITVFNLSPGDIVDFEITSGSTCTVLRVLKAS